MLWRFLRKSDKADPSAAGGDECNEIELLLSLYSDGMASAAETRRVESHLAECEACRKAHFWMRATYEVLSQRPTVAPPVDMSARIRRAIAEADAGNRPQVRIRYNLRPVYAMAASILVGAIVLGSFHMFGARHQTSAALIARNSPVQPGFVPVPTPSTPTAPSVAKVVPAPPVLHNRAEVKVADSEGGMRAPLRSAPSANIVTVPVHAPAPRHLPLVAKLGSATHPSIVPKHISTVNSSTQEHMARIPQPAPIHNALPPAVMPPAPPVLPVTPTPAPERVATTHVPPSIETPIAPPAPAVAPPLSPVVVNTPPVRVASIPDAMSSVRVHMKSLVRDAGYTSHCRALSGMQANGTLAIVELYLCSSGTVQP